MFISRPTSALCLQSSSSVNGQRLIGLKHRRRDVKVQTEPTGATRQRPQLVFSSLNIFQSPQHRVTARVGFVENKSHQAAAKRCCSCHWKVVRRCNGSDAVPYRFGVGIMLKWSGFPSQAVQRRRRLHLRRMHLVPVWKQSPKPRRRQQGSGMCPAHGAPR
jgi:hypothetical protein